MDYQLPGASGFGEAHVFSLGDLISAHQLIALDYFVADRTEIAVFKAGAAGGVKQIKRNMLAPVAVWISTGMATRPNDNTRGRSVER